MNRSFQLFLQNDSLCLPTGLACYKNEVMLIHDNCSAVLPCNGIYADVVKHDVEDLPMDKHVKHVLVKYREYKAGFNYDPGKLQLSKVMVTYQYSYRDWTGSKHSPGQNTFWYFFI